MAIKVKSNLSKRLIGRGKVTEYGEKVKELTKVANELSPEGGLYIMLIDKSEVFLPATKVIRDLMDLENIYSNRALQANPQLAEEFAEIATHMKAIENVVSRRRKKIFKKRNNQKQEQKEEEINE
jgi:hypothetical protein